jgi:SAM-dependent methyltransferase
VKNVETIVGQVDDPTFPKGALDLAVTAIVYHHLEQPVALLRNLALSLKPGATLVIVDPAYDRTGDKDSDRPTTRERVESEAAEAGYEMVAMNASLPRDNIFILRLKTGGPAAVPKITTTPWTPPQPGSERAAVLATVDTWWTGHDADDAALLEKVLAPGARSWFVHEGALQFVTFDKDIERIKSGNRRQATRPLPGEKRTVVDFKQERAVATVTMLVEIPRAGTTSRNYTTFQLYKADDRWQIVNLAGM